MWLETQNMTSDIFHIFLNLHWFLGPAVSTPDNGRVDLCSSPLGGSNLEPNKQHYIFLSDNLLYTLCVLYLLLLQVGAVLKTLELQESALCKGHIALFNCLVIGNTKFKGVQRVYCNLFPAKQFYGSHRLDLVMVRPQGIDNGAFVVSPNSIWYACVLLLFSACAMMDTGSKSFKCALVSTLETYNDPDNGNY